MGGWGGCPVRGGAGGVYDFVSRNESKMYCLPRSHHLFLGGEGKVESVHTNMNEFHTVT